MFGWGNFLFFGAKDLCFDFLLEEFIPQGLIVILVVELKGNWIYSLVKVVFAMKLICFYIGEKLLRVVFI